MTNEEWLARLATLAVEADEEGRHTLSTALRQIIACRLSDLQPIVRTQLLNATQMMIDAATTASRVGGRRRRG